MKSKFTLIFIAGFLFWLSFETPVYSQNRALRLEQVTNSLNISDDKPKESAITAKKVRQVGVSFPLTLEAEKVLRFWGATDELIEAVRQNSPPIPKPITQTVNVVTSPPESEVYMDDVLLGTTDAAGKARFTDVTVGERRVSVRKPRYREATFPISLASDKEGQITANLEMSVGFLTITTNVPNAVIDIPGMGSYRNSINKVEFPTGTYTVAASSPFYATSTREVTVAPGKKPEFHMTLEVDPVARNRGIGEAQGFYSRKQYDRAITSAKSLLTVLPKDSQSLTILAESLYMKDDFYSFSEYAKQSIDAGGSLKFHLQHHHFYHALHSVTLTLTKSTISFDPELEYPYCTSRQFTLPFQSVAAAQVEEVEHKVFSRRPRGTYLELKLKDSKNPKKTDTLNFADLASSFANDSRGIVAMESRSKAAQSLDAVLQLIRYASLQKP